LQNDDVLKFEKKKFNGLMDILEIARHLCTCTLYGLFWLFY